MQIHRPKPMSRREISIPEESVDAISGLANAEAALSRLVEHTDHIERLATLGTMAAGIAHEISNILTPALAYAQLALAHPNDEDLQAKAVEKAAIGIENATRIADAILGFAGSPGDVDASDVGDVVRAMLDCLAYNPNKDRIKVVVDVQPGTVVRMPPLGLQQVLMNLFLNARAAMTGERTPERAELRRAASQERQASGVPPAARRAVRAARATAERRTAERAVVEPEPAEPIGAALGATVQAAARVAARARRPAGAAGLAVPAVRVDSRLVARAVGAAGVW